MQHDGRRARGQGTVHVLRHGCHPAVRLRLAMHPWAPRHAEPFVCWHKLSYAQPSILVSACSEGTPSHRPCRSRACSPITTGPVSPACVQRDDRQAAQGQREPERGAVPGEQVQRHADGQHRGASHLVPSRRGRRPHPQGPPCSAPALCMCPQRDLSLPARLRNHLRRGSGAAALQATATR